MGLKTKKQTKNCLKEGPDVRLNKNFKAAIINIFKELKEIMPFFFFGLFKRFPG